MNIKSLIACSALLLTVAAAGALAHPKTDVITLYNGDRLTGEIKQLYGGLVKLKTDSMGTVQIEWQDMASVKSAYRYEVRTSSDGRFYGTLQPAKRPGLLRVIGEEHIDELEWLEVVELRAVDDSLQDRLDIYLSAGYSYTKASSVTQTTLNTDVIYENESSITALKGRTIVTDTNEETTFNNDYEITRKLWKNRAKFYRNFRLNYEDNDELGLEHRISAGGGIGRYFIDTHAMRLLMDAGAQATTESSVGEGEEQNVELYFSGNFAMWRFNSPELDLRAGFDLYPSVTDWGRLRTGLDLNLRWEIIEDLFFDITAWGTTDDRAESGHESDYGVTTGIGWEF